VGAAEIERDEAIPSFELGRTPSNTDGDRKLKTLPKRPLANLTHPLGTSLNREQ
jgi:hypothetical protein